jgi:hypothetical protein
MRKPLFQELLWLTDTQYEYLPKIPAKGTGIVKDKRFTRPHLVWIPGDLEVIPITTAETTELMNDKIAEMHDAIRRKHKPHEIRHTREQLTERFGTLSNKAQIVLELLGNDPFLYRKMLYDKIDGNNQATEKEISWLLEHGFIQEVKCRTAQKSSADFFPLTSVGHDWLETPESHRRPQPSHFRHTYYILKVALHLRKQGHTVEIEYTPERTKDGEPTSFQVEAVEIYERIDVYAEQNGERVAYEVTLSFSNLKHNIYKCFYKMDMDRVVIVCDLGETNKAERMIESYNLSKEPKDLRSMIEVKKITEFL